MLGYQRGLLSSGETPRVFLESEGGGAQESLIVYLILPSEFDSSAKLIRAQVSQTPRLATGSMLAIIVVGR